jgi:hypothetical protein|tara:strand:- start:419 stop:847 length:429 start_codon:yes stop_codon:yes gene_type:complete
MTISKDTLTTDIWDTIYTYIQTTNAISTNNIFSAWNSTLAKSKGYPLVIMFPPLAGIGRRNITGSFVESDVTVPFDIYHNSAQNLKVLLDDLKSKLMAGTATFGSDGLKRMTISGGDFDTWEVGKKKIHRTSLEVSFVYAEQ